MEIGKKTLKNMLEYTANLLTESKSYLSYLDSKVGDGDHGEAIAEIAYLINEELEKIEDKSLKDFFHDLGWRVLSIKGGVAAPLWGVMFQGLAEPLDEDENEIDERKLGEMFTSSLECLKEASQARVGDKTLMDVFIPVVESLDAESEFYEIFRGMKEEAFKRSEHTKSMECSRGKGRDRWGRAIGTRDPGAVSLSLFFRGLYEGF